MIDLHEAYLIILPPLRLTRKASSKLMEHPSET
jgi:hypothetical protein